MIWSWYFSMVGCRKGWEDDHRAVGVLDRPVIEKTGGARSTTPEGDVGDTHNGLRFHGCFRSLVIRLRRTH
ncbi:MAG TPA: hypothetical protein PLP18_07335 [Smithellaceae bacterium]|nr:hypothetical protein [Smithellaceae bacterium]